jgi:transcriptional regulator with XRE-family HTH domain
VGDIVFTRIYDVRTKLKVKQDELAKLSGVSQSQISKYEKGEVTNPSFDKLVRLAEALGVTVDDLKTKTDDQDFSPIRQTTSAVFVPFYQGKTKVRELDNAFAARLGFNRLAHQQIRKPSFLEYSDTAYAMTVYGDHMQPRYKEGDIIYADPQLTVQEEDNVVVSFKVDGAFVGVVREVLSINENTVSFKDLKSGQSKTFKLTDLYAVHVVVGSQNYRANQ